MVGRPTLEVGGVQKVIPPLRVAVVHGAATGLRETLGPEEVDHGVATGLRETLGPEELDHLVVGTARDHLPPYPWHLHLGLEEVDHPVVGRAREGAQHPLRPRLGERQGVQLVRLLSPSQEHLFLLSVLCLAKHPTPVPSSIIKLKY